MNVPVCPNCGSKAEYVDSIKVYYKQSYGMVWCCPNFPKCDTFVGVHKDRNGKDTMRPLGTMANSVLRKKRMYLHGLFDPLWKNKELNERLGTGNRNQTYAWLAYNLGIERKDCHMAYFDVIMCDKAIDFLEKFLLKHLSDLERKKFYYRVNFHKRSQLDLFDK